MFYNTAMPAWSSEIANDFIRLAAKNGRPLNQMQLQELIYIAHGWCLVISGRPLTGDRPEAYAHGPEYRRVADALVSCGVRPITKLITQSQVYSDASVPDQDAPAESELDAFETAVVTRVYDQFGNWEASELATLTRRAGTPWAHVFAGGAGERQDIPHELIRAQFVELVARDEK